MKLEGTVKGLLKRKIEELDFLAKTSNVLCFSIQGGTIACELKQFLFSEERSSFIQSLFLVIRKSMPLPDGCNSLFHKNFIFFRKIYPALIKSGGKKNL